MKINYVKTKEYLTVIINGKPYAIKTKTKRERKVLKLLKEKKFDAVKTFLDARARLKRYTKNEFKIKENQIYDSSNAVVPEIIVHKLASLEQSGVDYRILKNFWENLKHNPSENSRNQLYNYLIRNHYPLTEDGCFLAYKKVTKDDKGNLVDGYTKTIRNNIGDVVTISRKEVDDNGNNTCSTGLHVAAWKYAQEYSGEVLIEVKVNPEDVVSVPIDYDFQKMRVCRYTVLRIAKDEIKKEVVILDPSAIENMTARQIIEHVKNKTGNLITLSIKNKKGILKKAKEILATAERDRSAIDNACKEYDDYDDEEVYDEDEDY